MDGSERAKYRLEYFRTTDKLLQLRNTDQIAIIISIRRGKKNSSFE
jgi:hypothetical protein